MTIKTFNSGRQYTADGQRIAYLPLAIVGHGTVLTAMVDIDRQIDYMLVVHYPFGDAEVLAAYDNRTFSTEADGSRMHMQDGLKQLLREAAEKHGKAEGPFFVVGNALNNVKGSYELMTRRGFSTLDAAAEYLAGINPALEPRVVKP